MAINGGDLIADLEARGLVAQMTGGGELAQHLATGCRTLYCGFDPTADSLHIGSLVPLLTLRRFQQAGHKPVALVGGATGLIGDPSFKAQERKLNTPDVVASWVEKLKAQVSQFIDFDSGDSSSKESSAEVVNNLDWIGGMDLLTFLRDVGKHFSINNMINKESVKQRLDREGAGISYTEFTYMLLQSYDFAELNRLHNCTLQIGGSDQWGNITGGVDLTRRLNGNQVFGLTLPLVTKSDGTKFGKTESGTIWLDPAKTSPYAFYQFWINSADKDIEKLFYYFSFKSVDEIQERFVESEGGYRWLQMVKKELAFEITELVHGKDAAFAVEHISDILFDGVVQELSETDLDQLAMDGLPLTPLSKEDLNKPLTTILSEAGMGSGKQVKDALGRMAVLVNEVCFGMEDNMDARRVFGVERSRFGKYFLVKLGKKKHHLLKLV